MKNKPRLPSCGDDAALKQLEETERTRNIVPVNFPLEEMEILADDTTRTPQRGISLFV